MFGGFDSIKPWHGNIQYQHVRTRLGSSLDRCLAVTHNAHDFAAIARHKLTDVFKYLAVIVG